MQVVSAYSWITHTCSYIRVSYELLFASPDASEREGKCSSSKRNDNNSNASTTLEGERGYHDNLIGSFSSGAISRGLVICGVDDRYCTDI